MTGGEGTATYQWLANGEDIFGEDDETLLVTEDYLGSKLSVEVTDEEGNTAVSEETARVTADKSEDVEIVDDMGLQSDGTGIIGDRLRISYGATFGTPTAISWYKDGAVIATYSVGDTVRDGLTLTVNAALGTGTYKATVEADGKLYETNEILITSKEEQAEILGFAIEDDYTDGTDVAYATDDDGAIVTVTLSKNYNGRFNIYKANDSKYRTVINFFTTAMTAPTAQQQANTYVNTASGGTAENAIAVNTSVLTVDAPTNYQVANINSGTDRAIGHTNADGTITYKFHATKGALTRGSDYVIAFDQGTILTDTPGTGVANVTDAVTVPYVQTPASLAVTKVAKNNNPEVTFYDENGEVLKWFGKTGNGATLATAGISSAQIYQSTNKTTDPTASGVSVLEAGNTNRNADALSSGVWSAAFPASDTAFWFAQVKTTKGIFAATETTLTSEAIQIATDGATRIDLIEKGTSSVADAKTALVELDNLRTSGTVYIVRGFLQWADSAGIGDAATSDYYTRAQDIYKAYTEGISEAIVGQASVEAGAKSVEIANAISEWKPEQPHKSVAAGTGETWVGNNYIAVFIPDNDVDYGMVYTASGLDNKAAKKNDDSLVPATLSDSQGLTVEQVPTSLSFNKNSTTGQIETKAGAILTVNDTTAANFVAKDQFGTTMASSKSNQGVTSVEVVNKTITNDEKASATYDIADDGAFTLNVTVGNVGANTAKVDKGDGFKVTVLGSTITLTNKLNNPVDVATQVAATHTPATWEVKIGSDTICAPTATAVAAYTTALKNAKDAIAEANTAFTNVATPATSATYVDKDTAADTAIGAFVAAGGSASAADLGTDYTTFMENATKYGNAKTAIDALGTNDSDATVLGGTVTLTKPQGTATFAEVYEYMKRDVGSVAGAQYSWDTTAVTFDKNGTPVAYADGTTEVTSTTSNQKDTITYKVTVSKDGYSKTFTGKCEFTVS